MPYFTNVSFRNLPRRTSFREASAAFRGLNPVRFLMNNYHRKLLHKNAKKKRNSFKETWNIETTPCLAGCFTSTTWIATERIDGSKKKNCVFCWWFWSHLQNMNQTWEPSPNPSIVFFEKTCIYNPSLPNTFSGLVFSFCEFLGQTSKYLRENMSNILILVLRNKNHWFLELNRVENMCFICFGFHLLRSQLGMETDKTQLLGWLSLSPVVFSVLL